MKQRIRNINEALQDAWSKDIKVFIIYAVEDKNGIINHDAIYPNGSEYEFFTEKHVTINVSLSACRSFEYSEKEKAFIYDICVNGRTFFGVAPIESMRFVRDDNNFLWEYNKLDPDHKDYESKEIDYSGFPKLATTCANPKSSTGRKWDYKVIKDDKE